MKRMTMMLALTAFFAGCANGGQPLRATAFGGGLVPYGTPTPQEKPEEWTSQDCSQADQFSWPPSNTDDSIKAGHCVVLVEVALEVKPDGSNGCRVTESTPGVIFISPRTKRVFWRLRLVDSKLYRFRSNGIFVRKNTGNFQDEPTDSTRRFFSISRLTNENRVYAYDIQVERRSDSEPCTGYGPLILNRD